MVGASSLRYPGCDVHTYSNSRPRSYANAGRNTHAHFYANADIHAYCNSHPRSYANADIHSRANTYA